MLATLSRIFPRSSPPSSKPLVTEDSPKSIAERWFQEFAFAMTKGPQALRLVMHEDSWWRDMLTFSWDFRTLHGLSSIMEYHDHAGSVGLRNLKLQEAGKFAPSKQSPSEGITWTESMFSFETTVGFGKGMIRLTQDKNGVWKCLMIYTALQNLKGFPEVAGAHRPHGGTDSLNDGSKRGNWLEKRQLQKDFRDEDPTVLIIGAGQAGLNVGARLQALNISCLLIDKNPRIGDNWRNRYRTLVTHDPVQYTHMAYLPFPQNWPLFTPKDKLGDWFEAYASIMELNIWTSTTIKSASFSKKNKTWDVIITRPDGTERQMHPHHIIICTGHSGEPKIPSFPGQDTFAGTAYHGSAHKDASFFPVRKLEVNGKRVVVVGTGNSGHDIAQNYYENGASVTMLQRSGTYVIQADKGLFMLHEGLYDEGGPPTEDADIYGQSLPNFVQFKFNVGLTERIREIEKANLEGLKKAGFEVNFGEDQSGIYGLYITRAGGYYIDVGCSRLIREGKIKVVRSPEGIKGFERDGLVLKDGRKLEADIVVLATGYDNMKTSVEKIMGKEIAAGCKDIWDLDEEGEIKVMWRPSGHPSRRLWFMGGNLALCRIYSRFLALQIKAIETGLNTSA